jgi:hypothetical protein
MPAGTLEKLPKPDEHHTMTLHLGGLHDICKLHEF